MPHCLAQRQVELALDGQAELNRGLAVLRTAAMLAAGAGPSSLSVRRSGACAVHSENA
jgi:hypothetical protein